MQCLIARQRCSSQSYRHSTLRPQIPQVLLFSLKSVLFSPYRKGRLPWKTHDNWYSGSTCCLIFWSVLRQGFHLSWRGCWQLQVWLQFKALTEEQPWQSLQDFPYKKPYLQVQLLCYLIWFCDLKKITSYCYSCSKVDVKEVSWLNGAKLEALNALALLLSGYKPVYPVNYAHWLYNSLEDSTTTLLSSSLPSCIIAASSFLFIQLSHLYMFRWLFKLVFEVLQPLRQLGFHSHSLVVCQKLSFLLRLQAPRLQKSPKACYWVACGKFRVLTLCVVNKTFHLPALGSIFSFLLHFFG